MMTNTRRRLLLMKISFVALLVLLAGGCLLPAALTPDSPEPTYTPPEKLYLRRPTLTAYETTVLGGSTALPDFQQNPTLTPPTAAPPAGGLPDLVVYYYVVSYQACPWDGPGTILLNIQNRGSADAEPFNVTINSQPARVAGIPAGEALDAQVPFEAGPVSMIRAEIDPEGLIAESDRDNNTFYILFTPPPPCHTAPAS